MVALNAELEALVQQVKLWPVETRIALARRVLETLEPTTDASRPSPKGPPARQVLGLWNPGGEALTDEECERILVEELLRKHSP